MLGRLARAPCHHPDLCVVQAREGLHKAASVTLSDQRKLSLQRLLTEATMLLHHSRGAAGDAYALCLHGETDCVQSSDRSHARLLY